MFRNAFVLSRTTLWLLTFLVGLVMPAAAAAQARASDAYGKLPLHFEANRGQTHEDVRFLSRGPGYGLYLTAGEAVLALKRPGTHATPLVVHMNVVGGAPTPRIEGLEELPGKANYFIGSDPSKWQTGVPTYAKVQYRDVYPGIDLVYYGNQRQLEYDFVVAPGADPQAIVLDFKGVERLEIDARGELVMHAAGGTLRQHKPVVYQDVDGMRHEIAGGYVMKGTHRIAFRVADYDKTRPLIIDPVLTYSTYLGGNGNEESWSIAVDAAGNAYVVGTTSSTNFPTTPGAVQPALGAGVAHAFVTKLNAAGSALSYSTYLGGSGGEGGAIGIAVDGAGNAYVTGGTASSDFPTTAGAFQTALAGGIGIDAFVTKLNPAGSALVYSTYLGGSGAEGGFFRIALDTAGNAYLAGHTDSTDFPVTAGAFQTALVGNAALYVAKLDAAGSALLYSTYLGGSSIPIGGSFFKEGLAIAVDAAGSAYVAGGTTSNSFPTTVGAFQNTFGGGLADAFVTKFDAAGSALLYSTYLGGSGDEQAFGIAVDAAGNAHVTGGTASTNFPSTPGAFQSALAGSSNAFVTKLNAAGSALLYSTYLGGGGVDQATGIALDTAGNAFVVGATSSSNFPTSAAVQSTFAGGVADAFVTKLNATGAALVYSTYLGGGDVDQGLGIAVDTTGNAYVAGTTSSTNFPTTSGAFQTASGGSEDVFVAKLADVVVPPPCVGRVTGGGSVHATKKDIATFGFVVRCRGDGSIHGHLLYIKHAHHGHHAHHVVVRSVTFTTLVINGDTATFGGTCTRNGVPCTFTVEATDKGNSGRHDSFEITADAGPEQGGKLRSGNIKIHK